MELDIRFAVIQWIGNNKWWNQWPSPWAARDCDNTNLECNTSRRYWPEGESTSEWMTKLAPVSLDSITGLVETSNKINIFNITFYRFQVPHVEKWRGLGWQLLRAGEKRDDFQNITGDRMQVPFSWDICVSRTSFWFGVLIPTTCLEVPHDFPSSSSQPVLKTTCLGVPHNLSWSTARPILKFLPICLEVPHDLSWSSSWPD